MVGCLIIENSSVDLKNNDELLERLLLQVTIEKVVSYQTKFIIIYMFDIDKRPTWQLALNLEMRGIKVGYGFGKNKRAAKNNAEKRFAYMISD